MSKQVIDITVNKNGIHVRRGNNETGYVQYRTYDLTLNRMDLLHKSRQNDNVIFTSEYIGEKRYLVEYFINRKFVNEKRHER